ncbi:MAG: hypothetical protein JRJ12_04725 [Deltaproteobacteria bacterium]|nr:hypothetical protein [Deltaproteobacteria bacterium]MBW2070438.1 hypothetical protein [Deltaproteobacteria bacterium]
MDYNCWPHSYLEYPYCAAPTMGTLPAGRTRALSGENNLAAMPPSAIIQPAVSTHSHKSLEMLHALAMFHVKQSR